MVIAAICGLGVAGALATALVEGIEVSPPRARSQLMLGAQVLSFGLLIIVGQLPARPLPPAHPAVLVRGSARVASRA